MNPIAKSLLRFLTDDKLRVAVLKGEWGIGKTFFWREFLSSVKKTLQFRAYSYVSLFGAHEINDLKRQVFSNFEVLDESKMSKHFEKLKPITALLNAIEIPYINSPSPINDLIESKLVENFLICIDDLERKEDSISGSSVLGFISQLKEEKMCKIVLIYNDKELDEDTQKQINEYREKVVDLEFTYQPTINENLSKIWPENCPQCVTDTFHKLELNNIRVMQRVKSNLKYFADEVAHKYPELWASLESKCVMLTVMYYAYSKTIHLNEVLSTSYLLLSISKDDGNEKRFDVIKKLNYISEEQDAVIAEYLVNGYVDFFECDKLLKIKNEKYRLNDINALSREIWGKYHSNFVTPQECFIKMQSSFLKDHIKDLSIGEVASTVRFVRELDPSVDLEPLLSEAIDLFVGRVDNPDELDLEMLRVESSVIAKIKDKLAAKTQNYSITELFVGLAGSDSWNSSNIKHLIRFSEDDIYHWITTEESVDVVGLLKRFLGRFAGQNEEEKIVIERLKCVIGRLKSRSPLDRCRIEYLIECKR